MKVFGSNHTYLDKIPRRFKWELGMTQSWSWLGSGRVQGGFSKGRDQLTCPAQPGHGGRRSGSPERRVTSAVTELMWLIDNKPKNLNQIQYQNPVSWDMELGAGLGHTQARLKVTGQIIGIYPINRTSVKNLSIFILYHHQPWNFKQRIPTFVRPSMNRTQMFLPIVF